jgi:hypothetical protein
MIAAMNRGGDAAKKAVLKAKDIDMFAKPRPKKKKRVLKKSPLPLRKTVSSKARKKPRKKKHTRTLTIDVEGPSRCLSHAQAARTAMAATHRVLITGNGCMDAVKGSKEIDPPTADLILRHSRAKHSLANAFTVRQIGRVIGQWVIAISLDREPGVQS